MSQNVYLLDREGKKVAEGHRIEDVQKSKDGNLVIHLKEYSPNVYFCCVLTKILDAKALLPIPTAFSECLEDVGTSGIVAWTIQESSLSESISSANKGIKPRWQGSNTMKKNLIPKNEKRKADSVSKDVIASELDETTTFHNFGVPQASSSASTIYTSGSDYKRKNVFSSSSTLTSPQQHAQELAREHRSFCYYFFTPPSANDGLTYRCRFVDGHNKYKVVKASEDNTSHLIEHLDKWHSAKVAVCRNLYNDGREIKERAERILLKGFICVTGHSIDEKWTFQHCVLGFVRMPGSKESSYVRYLIEEKYNELLPKDCIIPTITSDGGSNFKKACRMLTEENVLCVAHTLHLIVTKAIELCPNVSMEIQKVRSFLVTLISSTNLRDLVPNHGICLDV